MRNVAQGTPPILQGFFRSLARGGLALLLYRGFRASISLARRPEASPRLGFSIGNLLNDYWPSFVERIGDL